MNLVRSAKELESTARPSLRAIIWDFDGTLADSNRKNYAITRDLFSASFFMSVDDFPVLRTYEDYLKGLRRHLNWRRFYQVEFGLNEEQVDKAGNLWAAHQESNETATPLFAGLVEVLQAFRGVPQGIVSQNAAANIRRILEREGCGSLFSCIVGYQDVPYDKQKPDAFGLLKCIDAIGGDSHRPGVVVYIGDHQTDIDMARNACTCLQQNNSTLEVLPVVVRFERPLADDKLDGSLYSADTPDRLLTIIRRAFAEFQTGDPTEAST